MSRRSDFTRAVCSFVNRTTMSGKKIGAPSVDCLGRSRSWYVILIMPMPGAVVVHGGIRVPAEVGQMTGTCRAQVPHCFRSRPGVVCHPVRHPEPSRRDRHPNFQPLRIEKRPSPNEISSFPSAIPIILMPRPTFHTHRIHRPMVTFGNYPSPSIFQ